jgi:hypothetical protein
MKRLNWKIIMSNIQEAREELGQLETLISSRRKPVEVELDLALRHAYHHLNTAWNVRHIETERYRKQSKSEFTKWSKFPKGFDDLGNFGTVNETL